MAQGRPTKVISMIKWIRTSRLPIKNSLSGLGEGEHQFERRAVHQPYESRRLHVQCQLFPVHLISQIFPVGLVCEGESGRVAHIFTVAFSFALEGLGDQEGCALLLRLPVVTRAPDHSA